MAATDTILSRLAGTLLSFFRIRDILLKRESSSALGARDNGDTGYVNVRGADPLTADDFVTRRYLDSTGAAGTVETTEFVIGLVTVDSVTEIAANTSGLYVEVQITTPYSPGATITIGKVGGSATLLMVAADINPQVAGIYRVDLPASGALWGAGAAAIRATIGGTPAAGAGLVRFVGTGLANT